jgi:hypothetical protein
VAVLAGARPHIVEALTCTLTHPSGKTLAAWLREIGFQKVEPSYSGGWFARQLFSQLVEERPPRIWPPWTRTCARASRRSSSLPRR